ncbi:c-type cytochrome [Marinomonas pollencensis]|uniref:Cytochrome c553 n=1 Tax=Marinomonas pollencensis TaxID=491954 RepID=A0A3E0DJ95_9GAMM|nr:c-type cytochrome [Marinomonas pollencensis]REG82679.1 cytochrome c553 [Marinomonas pollencensis]
MQRLCLSLLLIVSSVCLAQTYDASGQGKALTTRCIACHGEDGNGHIAVFPKLAGQQPSYLLKQLTDIQSGQRHVPQMAGLLDNYSAQDLSDIASYFAGQQITLEHTAPDYLEQGATLYRFGNPETGVTACAACHGPAGKGINSARFPALGGQFEGYTKAQLQAFKNGTRNNDMANIMQQIAKPLSNAEIDAVANYLQGLH